MDAKTLEKMMQKQADSAARKAAAAVGKEADKRLRVYAQEQKQKHERYLGALKEDMEHKMDAIFEAVQDTPEIKRKVDIMFDQLGELTADHEVLKDVVKDHSQRLQKLEA